MPSAEAPEAGCGDDDQARLRVCLLGCTPTSLPLARGKERLVNPENDQRDQFLRYALGLSMD